MSERSTHNDTTGKQRARATKRDIISRVRSLYGILFVFALAVTVRLIWIILLSPSVIHNAKVLEEGVYRITDIKARRGTIFSRDGEPLAISSLRYNVILDFGSEGILGADTAVYRKNVDILSKMLAQHFNEEDAREKHIRLRLGNVLRGDGVLYHLCHELASRGCRGLDVAENYRVGHRIYLSVVVDHNDLGYLGCNVGKLCSLRSVEVDENEERIGTNEVKCICTIDEHL